jgi:hypothetical protein
MRHQVADNFLRQLMRHLKSYGADYEMAVDSSTLLFNFPATLWILVVSSASQRHGKILGNRLQHRFPAPGGQSV